MSDACPPLFIVGLSRSGSTLVARMIDEHPQIAIFPETHLFAALDFVGARETFKDRWQYILFLNEVWTNLAGYPDPAAAVWANHAMRQPSYIGPTRHVLDEIGRSYARIRNARLWGEKTPGHALWLTDIWTLFPHAKVIFTVRDPRDVLVSYCERWNRGRFDTHFVMKSAANVRYHLDRLLRAPVFPSAQIHWVHYESLTSDPERAMRDICQFLEIDFVPEMLSFYETHRNLERESRDGVHHKLLSRPVSRERVGTFRSAFSPSLLNLIEEFLAKEMSALGYAPEAGLGHAPGRDETAAKLFGQRCYDEIASGKMRHEQRLRMRRKMWVYRHFNRMLACLPSTRLAVTSEDWRHRTAGLSAGRNAAQAGSD